MPKHKFDHTNTVRQNEALIPDFRPDSPASSRSMDEKDVLVWRPNDEPSDAMLDEYILVAKTKHGYNIEQALGILQWYDHDIERTLADLQKFTPVRDEWTVEEKVLFEQAFIVHGKNFQRIQQMLPHRPVSSLVEYYYRWKKTRSVLGVNTMKKAKKQKPTSSNKPGPSRSGPVKETTVGAQKKETIGAQKKETIGAQHRYNPVRARRMPLKYTDQDTVPAHQDTVPAPHDAGTVWTGQPETMVSLKRQGEEVDRGSCKRQRR